MSRHRNKCTLCGKENTRRNEGQYCGLTFALSAAVLGALTSVQFHQALIIISIATLIGYIGGRIYGTTTSEECRQQRTNRRTNTSTQQ